ncbi:DUF2793 domain-containing protein [Methylobacterium sp. JK268]
MSDATPNLALPLLAAAQAQKHVTHNEALTALDTLVQLAVLDKDLTGPPAAAAEGDRYLIAGASPTGAWSGWAGRVVRRQDGQWVSVVPRPGWLAYVLDEADLYVYAAGSGTAGAWVSLRSTLTALQNLARLGIGTTADAATPFAAKLNAALWAALTKAEGGSGDLRYTLNKEASGNTLSLLFQTGWSGRAEIGLTGDDDLHLKVSADGSAWTEALRLDRATGGADWRVAEVSAAAAATVDLGALNALAVTLTGTTAITSFGTAPRRLRLLRFASALTLTHDPGTLILPGGANLVTAAGDTALVTSDASGVWTVRAYQRASGKPLIGPAAAEITDGTTTGRAVLTAASAAAGATALGLGTGNSPTFAGAVLGPTTAASGAAASGSSAGALVPAALRLSSAYSVGAGYQTILSALAPNMATGEVLNYLFGQGLGAYNSGYLGYAYGGTNSPNSYVTIGLYASDRILNVVANGRVGIGTTSPGTVLDVAGPVRPGSYTVATVPVGVAGALIHVSNARKVGEAAGAGTGVPAYFAGNSWRRLSDDSPVAA